MRKFWKRLTFAAGAKHLQDKANNKSHRSEPPVIPPEAGDEVISYIPSMATLEGLPTEIQSAVLLNIGDIGSLESLILASPPYYSAYLSQRHAILKRVLFNSIHPDVLYDAFAAIDSTKTIISGREGRAARVRAFLANYNDTRDKWVLPEHLDLETLCSLARLQNHVQHSTQDPCQVATSSHPFPGTRMVYGEDLSIHERRRFHRAFYRFEGFCNLFRDWETPPHDVLLSHPSRRHHEGPFELEPLEKSSRFLSLFNPWEVEELACVRDYFFNYYRRMLHKFEPDLRKEHPHLDLSENGPWLEDNIEHLMARGLPFYRRMEMSPPDRQMRYLEHGLTIGPSFLSDALKAPPIDAVRQTMSDNDPGETHFKGDSICEGPNVMWLWTTGNKVDFDYFSRLNEPLRDWGYVFWDQKRLEFWSLPNEEYQIWAGRRKAGLRKALAEAS